MGSRRTCEALIAEGRVTVDGEVAVLGRRVDVEVAHVEVDGVPVPVAADLVSYLLNKPPGVVTTLSDPQGRRTVVELVPAEPRVFPVGRLDYDSEGLLVLTNDGELTQLLTHPSHGVPKAYLAEVVGVPTAGECGGCAKASSSTTGRRLRRASRSSPGTTTAPRSSW